MTGSWEEALARQQAQALRNQWRRFRIARITKESSTIKSFHLEAADGAGLPLYKAGQHLPIRLAVAAGGAPLIRTYTLSAAPSDGYYRISVKREGRVSQFLHEHTAVGDEIEARAPLGDFVVNPHERRPLVLLSAGVGCERKCWTGSLGFKPLCVEAPPSAFPNRFPTAGYVA
jgi:ferredoxin-NADP reductase